MNDRRAYRSNLTAQRLREVVHYDSGSGVFTRLVNSKKGKTRAGDLAGTRPANGYLKFSVDGVNYQAHRLAWLYVHGEWPRGQIDHKDTIRDHNWIDNLRVVTNAVNGQNRRRPAPNNVTGLLGVRRHPGGRFSAQIMVGGRTTHLGCFGTGEEAHAAYIAAKRVFHSDGCTL